MKNNDKQITPSTIDFVLDPMNANIDPSLNEHIDGIHQAKYKLPDERK